MRTYEALTVLTVDDFHAWLEDQPDDMRARYAGVTAGQIAEALEEAEADERVIADAREAVTEAVFGRVAKWLPVPLEAQSIAEFMDTADDHAVNQLFDRLVHRLGHEEASRRWRQACDTYDAIHAG